MLIPLGDDPIIVPVCDGMIGDIPVFQFARFFDLRHPQNGNGLSTVVIELIVSLYAKNESEVGNIIPGGDRKVFLVADNNSAVEIPSGKIIYIHEFDTLEDAENNISWLPQPEGARELYQDFLDKAEQDPRQLCLQGTFFRFVRDNMPVVIGQMIRSNILAADQMGKFTWVI